MTTPPFVQAIPRRPPSALGARYRIERPIGGWGMAEAYVAHDVVLDRTVIVKFLSPMLTDGLDIARFRREIALAASLRHPNLLSVLESGVVDDLPYYTMAMLPGETLRARMGKGPLAFPHIIAILSDVARGLGASHSNGVAHHDVRPEHVLCSNGIAMLTDCGVARALLDASNKPASSLARTGLAVSTPAYMAPEQANGESAGTRADWYAFGVMAYEMITGKVPFKKSSESATLFAHVREIPVEVQTRRPDVPAPLAALVMKLLVKDPTQRLHGREHVLSLLDAAVSDPDGEPREVWEPPPREAPLALSPVLEAASRIRPSGEMAAIVRRTPPLGAARIGAAPSRGRPIRTAPKDLGDDAASERMFDRVRLMQWAASLAFVALSTLGLVTLFRHDALDAAEEQEAAASTAVVSASGIRAPKVLVLAELPETDVRWKGLLKMSRDIIRMSVPGAASVMVTARDSALADTSVMRALVKARSGLSATIFRPTSAEHNEIALLLMTDSSSVTCTFTQHITSGRDTLAQINDFSQRVVGLLAFRYNQTLQSRLMSGGVLPSVRDLCRTDRFDAMQLLALVRGETSRPLSERVANLDQALRLDSTFMDAKFERARLLNDTTSVAGLAARPSAREPMTPPANRSTIVTQVEVKILNQIVRDPRGALTSARSAGALGQASATVWAMAAIGAGHPKEALDVLDRLGSRIDTVAGAPMGADIKSAMRTDAHYMMGHDALALDIVLPSVPLSPQMLSNVAFPVAAALGDSTHWTTLMDAAKPASPYDKVTALLLSADVASMAGRDAVAQRWYQRAALESEPLLRTGKPLPNVIMAVAMARRRARNFSGADALLAPLESSRDPEVARAARLARALLAVDQRDENAIAVAERWMRNDVEQRKHWDSALTLARLHALRGNATTAVQFLRTALSLGMPRLQRTSTGRVGDLRAEPDLKSLLTVPDGRALLLPAD